MQNNQYEDIPQISSALKILLRRMIEAKPSKRATLEEVRNNIWTKMMRQEGEEAVKEEKGWNEELLR